MAFEVFSGGCLAEQGCEGPPDLVVQNAEQKSCHLQPTGPKEQTYKSLVTNFDLPCFRWFPLCLLFLLRDP